MAGAGAGAGGDPLVLQQDRPQFADPLLFPPGSARQQGAAPLFLCRSRNGQNEIDGVARLSIRGAIRWRSRSRIATSMSARLRSEERRVGKQGSTTWSSER